MIRGQREIAKPREDVVEKLRGLLAGANCDIVTSGPDGLTFRHGTYLTQTAWLFPKTCRLHFVPHDGSTTVRYEIRTSLFVRVWLTLWAVVLCWTIFAPILAYRAIVHHPRRFVENLLSGV
jgi:hypothetical protein